MFFFLTVTATTKIYTLSLHDALPISATGAARGRARRRCRATGMALSPTQDVRGRARRRGAGREGGRARERKSTRLNSSHVGTSYAVCCVQKKRRGASADLAPDRLRGA